MSALTVDTILVALKAIVNSNVTPTVDKILVGLKDMITEWRRRQMHQRGKPQMWQTHISYSVVDPHVRENNVIHCVVDP